MSNVVRWEPFRDLVSLREAMDRLFEESVVRPRAGWPAPFEGPVLGIDMAETADSIIVKSDIPGIKAEDLEISITGDTLTIKGEMKVEEEINEENYIRRERRRGAFCRSLTIPVPVVTDKAEAEFENGVLTLTLPKAEEIKPKAIKIKTK